MTFSLPSDAASPLFIGLAWLAIIVVLGAVAAIVGCVAEGPGAQPTNLIEWAKHIAKYMLVLVLWLLGPLALTWVLMRLHLFSVMGVALGLLIGVLFLLTVINPRGRLARELHSSAAAARFAELNAAYEIIGDPDKRKSFDRGEKDVGDEQRDEGVRGLGQASGAGTAHLEDIVDLEFTEVDDDLARSGRQIGDPYDVLGITRSASAEEIKSAFQRIASELHPDTGKHDPRAASRFAEINAAYEIIGDKDKRKAFDGGEIDAEGFQVFEGLGPPFGADQQFRSAPSGQNRRPWRKILLACGGAALAYGVYVHQSNKTSPPIVPGWQKLISCSSAVSLDGSKELLLSEDHRAMFYDKSLLKDGKRYEDIGVAGEWSFDDPSKKYFVSLSGTINIYTLVSPEQVSTCMLIRGNLESADLVESWFSAEADDPGDYGSDP